MPKRHDRPVIRSRYVRETLTSLIDSAITIGKMFGSLATQDELGESTRRGSDSTSLEDMLSLARLMPVGARDNNLFVSFLSAFVGSSEAASSGGDHHDSGGWANEEGASHGYFYHSSTAAALCRERDKLREMASNIIRFKLIRKGCV